jgi:flagellar export protein FliJ
MPRQFIFKLQPVLAQRERLEERAQLKVAELERQRLGVEQTLKVIQAELLDTRRFIRGGLFAGEASRRDSEQAVGGMAGVRLATNASLHLTVQAQRAAMELAGILKRLDMARADLLKATADRKTVQLLKDRAREMFQREQLKREMAELDEMAVMRHGRGSDLGARILDAREME